MKMGVDFQAIGPRRILDQYISEDYTMIPGYYDQKKDNHCRICNEENSSHGRQACSACNSDYNQARKDGKSIQQIPVQEMSREEYLVFRAIYKQVKNGEIPYATAEEFAEEFRQRQQHTREAFRRDQAAKKYAESDFYD